MGIEYALTNLSSKEAKIRFKGIRANYYQIKSIIDKEIRSDWPEQFYDYLLKRLLFLEEPLPVLTELLALDFDKVREQVKALPENATYQDLEQKFSRLAWYILKFFGPSIRSIRTIIKGVSREILFDDLYPGFEQNIRDEGRSPEHTAMEAVLRGDLEVALKTLTPREREIIKRFYYDAEPLEKVASILGLDPSEFNRQLEAIHEKLKVVLSVRRRVVRLAKELYGIRPSKDDSSSPLNSSFVVRCSSFVNYTNHDPRNTKYENSSSPLTLPLARSRTSSPLTEIRGSSPLKNEEAVEAKLREMEARRDYDAELKDWMLRLELLNPMRVFFGIPIIR